MQSPNRDDRDDQYHQVTHDVDDAGGNKYGVLIDAILSSCNFVGFADAFGNHCEDEGQCIEKIPVENEPDAKRGSEVSLSFFSYGTEDVVKGLL